MKGEAVTILTPEKFVLTGIFFGPAKPKNIFIFIHGLGGSLFYHLDLIEKIIGPNNAALAFNNRGSGVVSRIKQLTPRGPKAHKSHTLGMSHEVFTDCVDDIDGAVKFVQKFKPKNIFLIGHSTGCQKSIYYSAKKLKSPVKGVILLAPMSDYADVATFTDKKVYSRALSFAKKMISQGKENEFFPKDIWPYPVDVQRFISLHTPDSPEEIFSYATSRDPKTLKKVKQPILVVLAEEDEYKDRPIAEIAGWFKNKLKPGDKIEIVKKAPHNFSGYDNQLGKMIKSWVKSL